MCICIHLEVMGDLKEKLSWTTYHFSTCSYEQPICYCTFGLAVLSGSSKFTLLLHAVLAHSTFMLLNVWARSSRALSLLWRRANAWNVSQHTLYGVQHVHINLTLIHCTFYGLICFIFSPSSAAKNGITKTSTWSHQRKICWRGLQSNLPAISRHTVVA